MSWGGNYSQSNASEPACYCVPYLHWAQGGGVEGWTIILVVHQKWRKRAPEVRAPISQVTQNLEWGVSVGYRERNNVALCASGAEKTNRFPWKEIMFGLHLRRPHKADQSHFCCVRRGGEGEEERISTATHSCTIEHAQHCQAERRSEMLHTKHSLKATHYPVIVILFGPRQNLQLCFVSSACLGITWPSGRVSRQSTGRAPLWRADGLAAGCCPPEGAALPYSVRQGVFIMQKEEEHERRRRKNGEFFINSGTIVCNFYFKGIIYQTLLSGRSFFNLPVLHKHWEKGF